VSRTRKGSKGPGYEVNRRREGKRGWRDAGPVAKRIGVRAVRRIGDAEAAKELAALCPECRGESCPKCVRRAPGR
jgi:hypothetical protein